MYVGIWTPLLSYTPILMIKVVKFQNEHCGCIFADIARYATLIKMKIICQIPKTPVRSEIGTI